MKRPLAILNHSILRPAGREPGRAILWKRKGETPPRDLGALHPPTGRPEARPPVALPYINLGRATRPPGPAPRSPGGARMGSPPRLAILCSICTMWNNKLSTFFWAVRHAKNVWPTIKWHGPLLAGTSAGRACAGSPGSGIVCNGIISFPFQCWPRSAIQWNQPRVAGNFLAAGRRVRT